MSENILSNQSIPRLMRELADENTSFDTCALSTAFGQKKVTKNKVFRAYKEASNQGRAALLEFPHSVMELEDWVLLLREHGWPDYLNAIFRGSRCNSQEALARGAGHSVVHMHSLDEETRYEREKIVYMLVDEEDLYFCVFFEACLSALASKENHYSDSVQIRKRYERAVLDILKNCPNLTLYKTHTILSGLIPSPGPSTDAFTKDSTFMNLVEEARLGTHREGHLTDMANGLRLIALHELLHCDPSL